MEVIIYGDFNCAYCYLASQRADRLVQAGAAAVAWRAVEHDRRLPLTGMRPDAQAAAWDRELAEVASLALPGERPAAAPPPVVSNTRAAVAAYAEAVTDGAHDELRRRLFRAIWADGRHISSAYDVRRIIVDLMWPPPPPAQMTPDLAGPLLHDADLAQSVRRTGGTITPDGGPLTTAGYLRIRRWRQEWLALPQQVVPAVIGPDGTLHPGADGLRWLAGLAAAGAANRIPQTPVIVPRPAVHARPANPAGFGTGGALLGLAGDACLAAAADR